MDDLVTSVKDQGDPAEKVSVSLKAKQVRIVQLYAGESMRTFSNALQFIIEDWERMKRAALEAASVSDKA